MSFSNKIAAVTLDTMIKNNVGGLGLTYPLELALFTSASSLGNDPGGTLADGDPSGTPVPNEVSGGSYDRVAVTDDTGWNAATVAATSVMTNNGAITFPQATAEWADGTGLWVNGWSLYDTNVTVNSRRSVFHGPFDQGKGVLTNDTVSVADTNLSLRLD